MDPAAMGGTPPADPAAMAGAMPPPPPEEPAPASGGMSPEDIEQIVNRSVEKALQKYQGGGAPAAKPKGKGKANTEAQIEALYKKVDVNNKLVRSLVDTLKIPIPPSVLDDPPPMVQPEEEAASPAPGASAEAKPEVTKGEIPALPPLAPAFDKTSFYLTRKR